MFLFRDLAGFLGGDPHQLEEIEGIEEFRILVEQRAAAWQAGPARHTVAVLEAVEIDGDVGMDRFVKRRAGLLKEKLHLSDGGG